MSHRLFLAAYFLLPGVALLLGRRWPSTLVLASIGSFALLLYLWHRRRVLGVTVGLTDPTHSNLSRLTRLAPSEALAAAAVDLKRRHDETVLRLVNTNIQLLSVRELWQALAQPGRLEHTVDGALMYCHRASGFQEVMILRLEPRTNELVGRWLHPGKEGPVMESLRWGLGGLSGAMARVLRHPQSVLAPQGSSEALLRVNGDAPAHFTEHDAYLLVPLLTPLPRQECLEGGWLYHQDCPSFELAPRHNGRARSSLEFSGGLDLAPCLRCRHYPLYGLMVVTDHGRQGGIHKADQLTLESLSYAVSAVLQNANLYSEVEREERFRNQILNGMTNGLLTADHRGRIIFANRRAQEILGAPASAINGSMLEDFLTIGGTDSLLKTVIGREQALLRGEGLLRTTGDQTIPVLVNAAPYQREEGGVRGVIVLVEDLSAVKAMQEEIRHLDTLAAIGRFASSMAHEIRNPLGGISAGIDYLERGGSITADESMSVKMIRSEISRLDGIIRRLFEVARPAKLQLLQTDPADTAKRVVDSLSTWAAQRGIGIQLEHRGETSSCHLDRDQIHQVLLNLVKNAVEASPRGEAVTLRVSSVSDDQGEDAIAFEVIDHGGGIDPEDLSRIYEPFFSRKTEGTGLGLFVSHSIVERHGGSLQVECRPGEETRFRVLLPLFPALIGSCP